MSELKVYRPWFERINVKALNDNVRRRIVEKVKEKLGYNKTVEVLDISKELFTTTYMELEKIPDEVVEKALQYLTESEFRGLFKVLSF